MGEDGKGAAGYCGRCGAALEDGASFCTQCGAAVEMYAAPEDDSLKHASHGDEDLVRIAPEGDSSGERPAVEGSGDDVDVAVDDGEPVDDGDDAAAESVTIAFGSVKPVSSAYVQPGFACFGERESATAPITPVEPTGVLPAQASVAREEAAAPPSSKKIAVIASCAVAMLVLAIVAAVGFMLFGGSSADDADTSSSSAAAAPNVSSTSASEDAATSSSEAAVEVDPSEVPLSKTYVTRWGQANKITYPDFTFGYPEGWSVVSESVSQAGENVVLENGEGVSVQFGLWVNASTSEPVMFEDMERVAGAFFKPGSVQGANYSSLGTFSVVRGGVRVAGHEDASMCYSLVPTRALTNSSVVDTTPGVPGFDYANVVSFTCMPDGALDAETEQEVVAILASLNVKDASSVSATARATGDYILSDSATRLYDAGELESLSNYELYLARNEIFARHGRMFVSEDLQKHFGSKPWYTPLYSPEEFDQSVLGEVEKKNAEVIQQIEEARNSPYLA